MRTFLLTLLLMLPLSARAETQLFPIVFERFAGARAGDQLTIEYRVGEGNWRRMAGDRIRPTLHLVVENADRGPRTHVTFDRDLTAQDGVVSFGLPSSLGRMSCEVWVTGGHRGAQIAWMDLGGFAVERAQLRIGEGGMAPPPVVGVPPPAAPPSVNWAAEPRVIDACQDAFDGPANEKACVQAVKSSPRDPLSAIAACESAFDGDENELQCLRHSVQLAFDPAPVISACEAAMDGDQNELECLRIAIGFQKDPSSIISACDSARAGDPDELDCLRTAAN